VLKGGVIIDRGMRVKSEVNCTIVFLLALPARFYKIGTHFFTFVEQPRANRIRRYPKKIYLLLSLLDIRRPIKGKNMKELSANSM